MGSREIKAAFNAVASPAYVANVALLEYDRSSGAESQIMTFSGKAADGAAFTFKSRQIRPGEDVNAVAAETAQKMLDQDRPS